MVFLLGVGPEGAWTLAKADTKSTKKKAAPTKADKPKVAAKGESKATGKAPGKPGPTKKSVKPAEKAPAKGSAKAPTKAPAKPSPSAPPGSPTSSASSSSAGVSAHSGLSGMKKSEPVKAPAGGVGAKGGSASGGKEGITIKTPAKKVAPPPPKNIPPALLPKSKGGSNAGPPPSPAPGEKTRFRNPFQGDFNDGKAAAAKLFAAAGLAGLKHTKAPTIEDEMAAKPLTKSPLNKTQLKEFREMLIAKRAEAAGDVQSMEAEALGGGSGSLSNLPQHMADQGTDTFDQSMALSMAASKRTILRDIDAALQRIEDNTYGICEILGKPIEIPRLQAEPWTRYSIEGARHKERMSMMR